MAKKVIVVRIGTNEVQIVHMEHTANYPTVYGCVRFPTPENAVKAVSYTHLRAHET